jgi:hypothetical protein
MQTRAEPLGIEAVAFSTLGFMTTTCASDAGRIAFAANERLPTLGGRLTPNKSTLRVTDFMLDAPVRPSGVL